jgi:ACS family tartrate transporter-like MFS transporter
MGAAQGAFWTVPLSEIGPDLIAEGIAAINTVGTLGGLVAPPAIGWVREQTGAFAAPVWAVAALMAAGSALILLLPRLRARPSLPTS